MKNKLKEILENFEKERVLVENIKLKKKIKKMKKLEEVMYLELISSNNETSILKDDIKKLQRDKREYLSAYKHEKELLRQVKMLLMQDGTTLKDIKTCLGVR